MSNANDDNIDDDDIDNDDGKAADGKLDVMEAQTETTSEEIDLTANSEPDEQLVQTEMLSQQAGGQRRAEPARLLSTPAGTTTTGETTGVHGEREHDDAVCIELWVR